ncbi:MAG: imidazole glycerol phosphate synthase subunit HisH [Pseudomonadota bacterium]
MSKGHKPSSKKILIGIIDYGAGNTQSMKNTVEVLGYKGKLIDKPSQLPMVDAAIIPGVGAFPAAMTALQQLGMDHAIIEFARGGKGIIGVCLGMQLLADISYEQGSTRGLGLIEGEVKALAKAQWHIGWNTIALQQANKMFAQHNTEYYFNHGYAFVTAQHYIIGTSQMGRLAHDPPITAAIANDNIYGFQFHPEKSQSAGIALMQATLTECLHA